MKVLLVQPPIEDYYHTRIRTYPLSLLYLAAALKDVCDVEVVDLRGRGKGKPLPGSPFPDLDPYYSPSMGTPFSLFSRYCRFGAGPEQIRRVLEEKKPDVVAISSLFAAYAEQAIEVARIAKEADRGMVTVLGGTHPTLFPGEVLENPSVDYVIRGEGETPLRGLVTALAAGVRPGALHIEGLCTKYQNEVQVSSITIENNIDIIPDRSLIDPARYRIGRHPYTTFLTSRGCPFGCAFCGKPPVPYRKRRLDGIAEEMGRCLDLGIKALDFEDDMLTLDRSFFHQVLDLFTGTGLVLSAMNGIYGNTLDGATLEKMWGAGFRRLNFSLVDQSPSVAARHMRPDPGSLLELFPFLEASGFLIEVHFILGLPGQTVEDVLNTLIFLMGRRVLPGPSVYYHAPGSAIFPEGRSDKEGRDFRTMRSSYMVEANQEMPRSRLYTLMKLTRFINMVKNLIDRKGEMRFISDLNCLPVENRGGVVGTILSILLDEKRFVGYDEKTGDFRDEPTDNNLVARFFEKARGKEIRGFRTMNSLIVQ